MSHKKVQDNLEQILRKTPINGRNVEYGTPSNIISEIDYYMYNNGILWIFEVKSGGKHYKKAVQQLNKHEKIWAKEYFTPRVDKIYKFFVTGNRKNNYYPIIKRVL